MILTFANDNDAHLPLLNRESRKISEFLEPHDDNDSITLRTRNNATLEETFALFSRYPNQVVVFHYGGHAGGRQLLLETSAGGTEQVQATGLAQLITQQENLVLVFLNGCATRAQVDLLLAPGSHVKAVIATSVRVKDKMATEFAEQFYHFLANGASISIAFNSAKAFVCCRYKKDKIKHIRFDGQANSAHEPAHSFPWGLYLADHSQDAQFWKLPLENKDTFINRDFSALGPVPEDPNADLIETLKQAIIPYNRHLERLVADYANGVEEVDEREIPEAVSDSFPIPIGEKLRQLFSDDCLDLDRLERLVFAYNTAAELLCFIMLSQLWDAKVRHPQLTIHDDYITDINSFFALNQENYQTFNHMKVIEAVIHVLKDQQVSYYIEEIEELQQDILKHDEFYKAYFFMEEIKLELVEDKITAAEYPGLCIQAASHLAVILKKMVFLVKYKLTTIKSIEIEQRRYKDPSYIHKQVVLDKISKIPRDRDKTYRSNTDSNSVVLLKDIQNADNFLSLSPFIIDINALENKSKSKVYFFKFYDPEKEYYYYLYFKRMRYHRSLEDKDIDQDTFVISNDRQPFLKDQFEEFKDKVFS